jgi:hypothetical protein
MLLNMITLDPLGTDNNKRINCKYKNLVKKDFFDFNNFEYTNQLKRQTNKYQSKAL